MIPIAKDKNKLIPYYHELVDPCSKFVYSIDNVRINFRVQKHKVKQLESFFNSISRTDIETYGISSKQWTYKYMFTFRYSPDASMTVAYQFLGADAEDVFKGYLDVNINKTGSYGQFWADYRTLKSFCLDDYEANRLNTRWTIARCDVAVDMPAKRRNVFMRKDQRVYELKSYSADNLTEYLGKRNEVGRVKIYNKSLELGLSHDVTRYEITCEPNVNSYFSHAAEVYNLDNSQQLSLALVELSDSQRVIVNMFWEMHANGLDRGLLLFNQLGRKIKDKLKPFIVPELALVTFNRALVTKLFDDYLKLL